MANSIHPITYWQRWTSYQAHMHIDNLCKICMPLRTRRGYTVQCVCYTFQLRPLGCVPCHLLWRGKQHAACGLKPVLCAVVRCGRRFFFYTQGVGTSSLTTGTSSHPRVFAHKPNELNNMHVGDDECASRPSDGSVTLHTHVHIQIGWCACGSSNWWIACVKKVCCVCTSNGNWELGCV